MKREVKIGIFAVLMIGCAWAGIRFLSGIDIFSRNVVYYAAYDQVNGVQTASPIMLKGVKIGTVTGVSFDPSRNENVVLQLTVKRQYRIPSDSEAKIVSNGIMGSKAIDIVYGSAPVCLEKGDTLRSGRDRDLMDVAGSELEFFKQRIALVVGDLSRTLENVNALVEANAESLTGTLANLHSISGNAAELLAAEKQNLRASIEHFTRFSEALGENAERLSGIVGHVDTLAQRLNEGDFAGKLSDAVGQLDELLRRLNEGDGSLARLMNDPQLYDSLTRASGNLASLLADLQAHPKRYVHFSLFGRSEAKEQAKAEKRAAEAAAKAERDSLRRLRRSAE